LLFEAGEKKSQTLLKVGDKKTDVSHENNPLCFSDVYFRVGGGKYAGKVDNCVTINSNDVIGAQFLGMAWRPQHQCRMGYKHSTKRNYNKR